MKQPLVSIGLPTFNRPAGLRKALACIAAQDYENLEVIVSDNASPGTETADVIRSFAERDPRIKAHRQASNIGAINNFQFVLTQATGHYFAWFADDDVCEPTFISELAACLDRDPTIALAMSDVLVVDDVTPANTCVSELSSIREEDADATWIRNRSQFFAYPPTNTFLCVYGLYRTDVLRRCQLDHSSVWKGFVYGAEVPLLAEVATHGKIVSIPKALKTYVSHAGSLYIGERSKTNRLDTMIRRAELRLKLSMAALRADMGLRERLSLSAHPWKLVLRNIPNQVRRRISALKG